MSVWIFGYGSLLWRPGFPYVEAKAARVAGLSRRLEQGSPDHRGTPERLGRVATLVPAPNAHVGGLVYALAPAEADAILAALDEREQGGYDRVAVRAELHGEAAANEGMTTIEAITWIARPGNPWHLGPAPFETMVADVLEARGPSGTNVEYVLRLAETLTALGFEDDHVSSLAEAVRAALVAPPRYSTRT
ncbi:gamma-glutamylcyclotransferase [Polyangium jinanense]|uniref:glutathione-specific gamma-glutamylcyclotransferase n=1 Tax=Polyangium jinanense TaxID=2829994 RepID=A0A9X4AVC8_9BACT|nr:gamma-glutamylcyclotransferase [Polyangium jinanense]MDC3959692.1 gamma-glutamylcyclotransferase [Polyangium jinanense]MDC3984140.1 gamma-glutamylcyclotransferase [Polyangium jinanense]